MLVTVVTKKSGESPQSRVGNSLYRSFTLVALLNRAKGSKSLLLLFTLFKERQKRFALVSQEWKSEERKIDSLYLRWFALFKSGLWRKNFKFVFFTLLSPFVCPKQDESDSLLSLFAKRANTVERFALLKEQTALSLSKWAIHTKNQRANSHSCLRGANETAESNKFQ